MPFFRQFPKTQYDFFNRGVSYEITDFFRYVNTDATFLDDVSVYSYYRVQNGERPDIVSMKLYGTPDYYWTFFIANDHLKSGIANWPMSAEMFEDYMKEEYEGYAITSRVDVVVNADGEKLVTNTLADEFPIGIPVSAVHNNITTSTGVVYARNPQLSQLVIKDVVELTNPPFVNTGKIISGTSSDADTFTIKSWTEFRNAIHHFEDQDGNITYSTFFFDPDESTPLEIQNLTIVTNYEYESKLNDERGDIRIIKPALINQFAHQYRTLINAN